MPWLTLGDFERRLRRQWNIHVGMNNRKSAHNEKGLFQVLLLSAPAVRATNVLKLAGLAQ